MSRISDGLGEVEEPKKAKAKKASSEKPNRLTVAQAEFIARHVANGMAVLWCGVGNTWMPIDEFVNVPEPQIPLGLGVIQDEDAHYYRIKPCMWAEGWTMPLMHFKWYEFILLPSIPLPKE